MEQQEIVNHDSTKNNNDNRMKQQQHIPPNKKQQNYVLATVNQQRRRRLHHQQQQQQQQHQHQLEEQLECYPKQDLPPQNKNQTENNSPQHPLLIHFPYSLSLDVPAEVLGLIESYLSPSECAYLSATCLSFHRRWSTRRWKKTFQLHYGYTAHTTTTTTQRTTNTVKEEDEEEEEKKDGVVSEKSPLLTSKRLRTTTTRRRFQNWEDSFVGCCCDDVYSCSCLSSFSSCPKTNNNNNNNTTWCMPVEATQFNVKALIPSVTKAYTNVWDTIELAFLGYYDSRLYPNQIHNGNNNQYRHTLFMQQTQQTTATAAAAAAANNTFTGQISIFIQALRNAILPHLMEYCFFVVGHKLLVLLRLSSTDDEYNDNNNNNNNNNNSNLTLLNATNTKLPRYLIRTNVRTGKNEYVHPMVALQSSATSMSAWKLACILKERGVDCLRCGICDQIDLMDDDGMDDRKDGNGSDGGGGGGGGQGWLREFRKQNGGGHVWMSPCNCPELVHRVCLEKKLGLVPRLAWWEWMKRRQRWIVKCLCFWKKMVQDEEENEECTGTTTAAAASGAHRVWISYDDNNNNTNTPTTTTTTATTLNTGPAAVDSNGCFKSSAAKCPTCHVKYKRSVRLPRSKSEVIISTLSDPVAIMRFVSTISHFVLCILFLAATEGMCFSSSDEKCHLDDDNNDDDDDENHQNRAVWLMEYPIKLKWPSVSGYFYWDGLALAWWQLWQCCMLHIFFSPRFEAIVDRLWMGPISFFYCRLYLYFLCTSALLAVSYIPVLSRSIVYHLVDVVLPVRGRTTRDVLRCVWNVVKVLNLLQFAAMSTTVICIFWRTNYRIFTVADGRGEGVGVVSGVGDDDDGEVVAMRARGNNGVAGGGNNVVNGGTRDRLEGDVSSENDVRLRRGVQQRVHNGNRGRVSVGVDAVRRDGVGVALMTTGDEGHTNNAGLNPTEVGVFPHHHQYHHQQQEMIRTHHHRQHHHHHVQQGRNVSMAGDARRVTMIDPIGIDNTVVIGMAEGNDNGDMGGAPGGAGGGNGVGGGEVGLGTGPGGVGSWSTHPIYHGQWQ